MIYSLTATQVCVCEIYKFFPLHPLYWFTHMFSIIVTAAWASFAPTPPPPAAAVGTTQVVRPHSDFFLRLYFYIATTHIILAHHATQTYTKRPRLTRIGVRMTHQYTQYEYLRFGGTVNAPEKFNCGKVSIDSFFP